MKVLVASVVHTALDARIHQRQIRALVAEGVQVTQIAPWSASGVTPGGGTDGVTGVDVPRAVGRRRFEALREARRAIVDLGPRHDLILLHDPELVLAVAGRLRRLPPVVLDVHEDLAASLPDRAWLPRPLRGPAVRFARGLERWSEDRLAGLLLAEEGYRGRFAGDHPVVPNYPWRSPADPIPVDTGRVVYVGRISMGRGARELVAIAARLRELDGPQLHLVGVADADVEPLLREAQERGELRWHGFLPNPEAMALVRGSLAGLAPLHDLPNYRVSMPTKVVEYLANGVPAIVTPLPAAVDIVTRSQAGIVVPFGDVEASVAAILELAADPQRRARMGADGRGYVEATATWDLEGPRFVAHLRAVAGLADERPASEAPLSEVRGGDLPVAGPRVVDPRCAGYRATDPRRTGHRELHGRVPVPQPTLGRG